MLGHIPNKYLNTKQRDEIVVEGSDQPTIVDPATILAPWSIGAEQFSECRKRALISRIRSILYCFTESFFFKQTKKLRSKKENDLKSCRGQFMFCCIQFLMDNNKI